MDTVVSALEEMKTRRPPGPPPSSKPGAAEWGAGGSATLKAVIRAGASEGTDLRASKPNKQVQSSSSQQTCRPPNAQGSLRVIS